jgi:hypothetical protein
MQAAARCVPGTMCLPQALAAEFLLARHAHPARLCIGMTSAGRGRVRGHAWVESNEVVIGGGAEEYQSAPLEIVARESR